MNIQDVFNSAQVLVNIALRAQKAGLLSLDEAVTTKQSIDIQTEYYKGLGEQIKAQEEIQGQKETGSQIDGEPLPADKPKAKGKTTPKVVK